MTPPGVSLSVNLSPTELVEVGDDHGEEPFSIAAAFLVDLAVAVEHAESRLAPPQPSARPHLAGPLGQLECPAAGDKDTRDDVDEAHEQAEEAGAALADDEQDRLDVVLEEDARHRVRRHLVALRGRGVLVGEDGLGVGAGERVGGVAHDAVLVAVRVGRQVQRRRLRDSRRVEAARARDHAALGEDGRHDAQVVLVPHEVRLGRVRRLVQRVQQVRVVRAERQLVDVVREVELPVVQVLVRPELHVPVPARRDVEVALHLVALQRPVDPAAVHRLVAREPWRLGEFLALVLSHVAQHVADVRVFLFRLLAFPVPAVQPLVDALLLLAQAEHSARIHPRLEVGVFLGEQVARHDPVHRCVLHVDVKVLTRHGHHDVQVELQFMTDTSLHAEVVCFAARPPCP